MKLIKINAIGSTNDYLKELIKTIPLEDGTLVTAEKQTKGRGQMGASWFFEEGKSLAFSVFKKINEWPVADQFYINFAVCVGVHKALKSLGIPKINIKWPNDILSDGKKIGGILVETQFQNMRMISSVIGVGLNVNNVGLELYPQASSMLLSSGIRYDLDEVRELVAQEVFKELKELNSETKNEVHQAYEKRLFRKGITSIFEDRRNKQFEGIIEGVGPEGRLRVRMSDQSLKTFELKEIQLRY